MTQSGKMTPGDWPIVLEQPRVAHPQHQVVVHPQPPSQPQGSQPQASSISAHQIAVPSQPVAPFQRPIMHSHIPHLLPPPAVSVSPVQSLPMPGSVASTSGPSVVDSTVNQSHHPSHRHHPYQQVPSNAQRPKTPQSAGLPVRPRSRLATGSQSTRSVSLNLKLAQNTQSPRTSYSPTPQTAGPVLLSTSTTPTASFSSTHEHTLPNAPQPTPMATATSMPSSSSSSTIPLAGSRVTIVPSDPHYACVMAKAGLNATCNKLSSRIEELTIHYEMLKHAHGQLGQQCSALQYQVQQQQAAYQAALGKGRQLEAGTILPSTESQERYQQSLSTITELTQANDALHTDGVIRVDDAGLARRLEQCQSDLVAERLSRQKLESNLERSRQYVASLQHEQVTRAAERSRMVDQIKSLETLNAGLDLAVRYSRPSNVAAPQGLTDSTSLSSHAVEFIDRAIYEKLENDYAEEKLKREDLEAELKHEKDEITRLRFQYSHLENRRDMFKLRASMSKSGIIDMTGSLPPTAENTDVDFEIKTTTDKLEVQVIEADKPTGQTQTSAKHEVNMTIAENAWMMSNWLDQYLSEECDKLPLACKQEREGLKAMQKVLDETRTSIKYLEVLEAAESSNGSVITPA